MRPIKTVTSHRFLPVKFLPLLGTHSSNPGQQGNLPGESHVHAGTYFVSGPGWVRGRPSSCPRHMLCCCKQEWNSGVTANPSLPYTPAKAEMKSGPDSQGDSGSGCRDTEGPELYGVAENPSWEGGEMAGAKLQALSTGHHLYGLYSQNPRSQMKSSSHSSEQPQSTEP